MEREYKKGDEILVINTDNYKESEEVPFKAVITDLCVTSDVCYWVKSLVTGNEYELYDFQFERI